MNDDLLAAISEAGQRRTTVGFGWASGSSFITHPAQLQSLPPFGRLRPLPPKPPRGGLSAIDAGTADKPSSEPVRDDVGARAPTLPETGLARLPEAKRVGGVSVQLDIAVERRRFFWWRLALSLVVRRLR